MESGKGDEMPDKKPTRAKSNHLPTTFPNFNRFQTHRNKFYFFPLTFEESKTFPCDEE